MGRGEPLRKPLSVAALNELGRVRLSKSFFVRDFLFSDIAAMHGFTNAPGDPDLMIAAGERLCQELLEPLQDAFGRLAIRSAYRSAEVNGFGAEMQRTTNKAGYTCASNAANAAGHIWDLRDADGCMGATACIVVPAFWTGSRPRATGGAWHGGCTTTCLTPAWSFTRGSGRSTCPGTNARSGGSSRRSGPAPAL